MATTEIHAVRTTPELALNYVMADKYIQYVEGMKIWDDCPHEIVELPDENGLPRKYVRYFTLKSFSQCNPRNPMDTYNGLREKFQNVTRKSRSDAKGGEPLMWHAHQSFKGREVDPVTANQIGLEIARTVFKGFPVTVTTHTDGNNIHNHFMISAWGVDGKKWNNDLNAYRRIRKESDRLCREHNLSVLANTEEVILTHYTGADGKRHSFEPTARKIELIQKREAGDISTDDVNSYRNTEQYREWSENKLTNQQTIKRDIDTLLPSCRSYDELLSRLRGMGYRIRDKKKNGEWLAHVAFQPPTADKATREDKIGDGSFYLRENLSAYIAEQFAPEELEQKAPVRRADIPYFSEYEYGVTDISQIDDNWRKTRNEFGVDVVVPRKENEKKVIADVREADREVRGLIDTTALRKVIAEQGRQRRERKPYLTHTQEQRLVARINNSFRCLKYTETNDIYNYRQIIDLYRVNKRTFDDINGQLATIKATIARLEDVLTTPGKAAQLEERITREGSDLAYQLEQLQDDTATLKAYQAVMRKYKIDTPDGFAELKGKVDEFSFKAAQLETVMNNAAVHMVELENCMRTYNRIDRRQGRADDAAWQEFMKLLNGEDGSGGQKTGEENRQGKQERKNKEER